MKKSEWVVTLPEFAEMTGNSRGHIYDLARRNLLPVRVIKLGRRLVLSRNEIEALLGATTPSK